jgi:hypothetical protein
MSTHDTHDTHDRFETRLASAFTARADVAVRPDALDRLRSADYRPRAHRVRTPAALGALAGSAGAATAVTFLVFGSAPAAYAGWSPTPTAAAPAPSAPAQESCQGRLASMPGQPGTASGSVDWQNVATDVRGPFTVALYQAGDDDAACFTSASFTEISQIDENGSSGSLSVQGEGGAGPAGSPASGGSSVTLGGTASGDLQQVAQTRLSTTTDGPYTLVAGRTENGVTGVTLVRDDGQDVVATVADGWLVAWWPGSASIASAQVTTASGTMTQALVPAPKPGAPCPGVSSSSAPSAGGPSFVSRSGGSAQANPGNAARCAGNSGSTGNSGNSANSGSAANSGNSGKGGPG